ncbi:MAG: protoporphyrinogen oxidase [Bryobacteraceae bacterium]
MQSVLIVGGGISGLSAAYYLNRAGVPATLVESQPRLGGVIRTEIADGCVIEAGPDSFLSAKPAALHLIRELGLEDEVIGSNDHLRRTYIRKRGRLIPLPDGLMFMAPTRLAPMAFTPLLSWTTKLRMAAEYFRKPSAASPTDRSVADFIRDHYGQEAVDYLTEPLLAGVYGGDPERLSVSSVLPRFSEFESRYGSLTRGALAARRAMTSSGSGSLFRTLKNGLGDIIAALELAIRPATTVVHGSVETVEPSSSGFRARAGGRWIEAAHVVLACPAWRTSHLTVGTDPELSHLLAGIEYSSSMTVALVYDKAALNHPQNGFGFLVPRKERGCIVACTWVGTKFSHRVPDNRALLRCFLGGSSDEEVLNWPDESVIRTVRAELAQIMGVQAEPLFTRIARWPRSMAQYTVGHQARMERVRERLGRLPGLHLAGNAYDGIGIPDCIRSGKEAAERIARAVAT